jgi:hypothetical protein
MKDLLLEVIDRFMTTQKGTSYRRIKAHLPPKSKTLQELMQKHFLEEITNLPTNETVYFPRMLAFEAVGDPRRRKFAQGLIGRLLFELRDVHRQGSPYGLEGVIVDDLQIFLALDFMHYMTQKLVYVKWFEQVYPRDRRPV